MQTSDEPRDPAALLRLVREAFPVARPPDDGTRLGRMLGRLTAALEAAAAGHSVSTAVRDDLIGLVPRLHRYANALTADREEADDLVQATLLMAWEQRERLTPGPALAARLFAALRNDFLHERLRGRRRRPVPSPAPPAPDAAADEDAGERRAVQAALDRLTAAQREALLLVTVEGLARPVAAGIIGCPPAAVTEALDAAHARLARDLSRV